MKPKQHRLAESLRSGLSRLRRFVQRNGWLRSVVIHLIAHVILFQIVVAALLFLGFSTSVADMVAVLTVAVVAYAIDDYMKTKLDV